MIKETVAQMALPDQRSNMRPTKLRDFIGQARLKENLSLMIRAAKLQNRSCDHLLFSGPSGHGKTTISLLLAHEMKSRMHVLSGPNINKKGELIGVLMGLAANDILFIDEIHRLPMSLEEVFYSAMEDFKVDLALGKGTRIKAMNIQLKPFTLVGATTKHGDLSSPFRDRFQGSLHFSDYTKEDIEQILLKNAEKFALFLDQAALVRLANASRNTPRVAINILRRVRDMAIVKSVVKITDGFVVEALELLGIQEDGLDMMGIKVLKVIGENFNGGPVGLETISMVLGEDKSCVSEVYEPYLLRKGLLIKTRQGRMLTDIGLKYLKNVI